MTAVAHADSEPVIEQEGSIDALHYNLIHYDDKVDYDSKSKELRDNKLMVSVWIDFTHRYKQFRIVQSKSTNKIYALRLIPNSEDPTESSNTPRLIGSM